MIKVESTRLGELKIGANNIYTFKNGLPGFEDEKKFALIPLEDDSPFAYLQSLQTPELTFALVNPFQYFPDYEFKADLEEHSNLEISPENKPYIYTIANIPKNIRDMTINLAAPIVFDPESCTAVQIIIQTEHKYDRKQRLFTEEENAGEKSEE